MSHFMVQKYKLFLTLGSSLFLMLLLNLILSLHYHVLLKSSLTAVFLLDDDRNDRLR